MKNIQVIDGARNCRYPIYSATDDEFAIIFPGEGQDIEFIEDAICRVEKVKLEGIMRRIWSREIEKPQVLGIHGTLFYELDFKKVFYPTKKEAEMVFSLK